jgi:hypothetical protein|tara:strand:+ start:407 stop:670 length:264 start_codon:yes stop_codon:yes gene_type:complete
MKIAKVKVVEPDELNAGNYNWALIHTDEGITELGKFKAQWTTEADGVRVYFLSYYGRVLDRTEQIPATPLGICQGRGLENLWAILTT